ncbi:hypothetical protein GPALN_007873 [Globodera pallida]|nr:hypothetical protein GPALN_007873 [Globodera pallida]
MSEKCKIWAQERETKRRKLKEGRRTFAQHMNKAISGQKILILMKPFQVRKHLKFKFFIVDITPTLNAINSSLSYSVNTQKHRLHSSGVELALSDYRNLCIFLKSTSPRVQFCYFQSYWGVSYSEGLKKV